MTDTKVEDQFFAKYDSLIENTIDRYHVSGLSVAVIAGTSTFVKGYGLARRPNEAINPSTLFDAASMTKAQVAACVSLLVDERSDLEWTTPVSQVLDDFVLPDPQYTRDVTIEDILSHRSGMPDIDEACFGMRAKVRDTPRSVCRKLRHLPLTAPLRSKYQYCNAMFVVAVHLIETLSGESMHDFLRRKLWKPLGMQDTYLGQGAVRQSGVVERVAKGYGWDGDKQEYFDIPWPEQPEAVGAGEMVTTPSDYARFVRCLMSGEAPISEAGHKELLKPRTIAELDPKPFRSHTLYALGVEVETFHGEVVVGHTGSTDGFESKMIFLPGKQWGVVIMANTMNAWKAIEKIVWALVDDLLDVPQEKRFDWDQHWASKEEEDGPKTIEELFPNIPKPPIPLTLPLEAYAGTYSHPGFGDWLVAHRDGKLVVDARDRTWQIMLTFQHISGEFFAVEYLATNSREKDLLRAEFKIGADGTVDSLGIALIYDVEELIWHKRQPIK